MRDGPSSSHSSGPEPDVIRVGCDDCVMSGTEACDDCLVTFVHTAGEPRAIVLDLDEFRALRRLQAAGLVPDSRHVGRVGGP